MYTNFLCTFYQKLPVDDDNPGHLLSCLQMEPVYMKHRIMLLEELGVKNVHIRHIFGYVASLLIK